MVPSPLPQNQHIGHLSNGAAHPIPAQNGTSSTNEGTSIMVTPAVNGASQAGRAGDKPSGSIEESKIKAKAVMAASGISTASIQNGKSLPDGPAGPSDSESMANGTVHSRKRSRSGTRLPQTSPRLSMPARTKEDADKVLLEQYVNRDLVHSAAMIVDKFEQNRLIRSKVEETDYYKNLDRSNPAAIYGRGYAGYGNGDTAAQARGSKILYPAHKRRLGGRKTKELRIPRKERETQAEQIDELAPIRLDIEWDKIRLRDTFTWNIHDRTVPVDLFAEQLVEDFKLPLEQYGHLVTQVRLSLEEQIRDFHPQIFIDEEALDPHLPYSAYKNDEMRITIKLNITIGQHTLMDQFEWELNNPMNSAEDFARQMTHDLQLSGEFTTAIAHSIREQCQLFTKSLYVIGHPFDGRPIEDQELKASFLPSPIPATFRPYQAAKDYSPYLYELNEAELEKTELSMSREERRQKRSVNRRGGPALPDVKDRRRTIRTLVVSSVLPGAAETLEDSRIFKRTVTASGKARRPGLQKDGLDDSDESDSEDSSPDSPAVSSHLLVGTARTRGMRGAATAAQAAMRATQGRSVTPDTASLHHHETRTSGRRGKEFLRDDSVDESPPSYVVKLRIAPKKLRQLQRGELDISKSNDSLQPGNRTSSRRSASATPGMGSMLSRQTEQSRSMGPPSTPNTHQPRSEPTPSQQQPDTPTVPPTSTTTTDTPATNLGRVDALGPPGPDFPFVSTLISPRDTLLFSVPTQLTDLPHLAPTANIPNLCPLRPPSNLPTRPLRRHNALHSSLYALRPPNHPAP